MEPGARRRVDLGGQPVMIQEARDGNGEQWLVGASFSADGRRHASPLPAQLRHAAFAMARLRSGPAAVELWRAPCKPDCAAARAAIGDLVARMSSGD
jgi:hypothetical protein